MILILAGCSPLYVLEAAYNQSGILLRRQSIDSALKDKDATPTEVQKLKLVQEAREYAIQIGLKPGDSFTKYSRVDSDVLAWVVMGSKKDAFELYTWWFPIVGSVPYKGYFDKEDAESAGKRLEQKGYETFIRGTDAFSTLGWFNDPILSTTLRHSETRIVNTVLHESLHSTVWIPGHVPFNESLANFVGAQAAIHFFEAHCQQNVQYCEWAKTARQEKERELEFGQVVEKLYIDLENLYSSKQTSAQILAQRQEVFDSSLAPVRAKYPNMKVLKEINNAEIMQLKVYMTKLPLFELWFQKQGSNWTNFLASITLLKNQLESEPQDPFLALEALLNQP